MIIWRSGRVSPWCLGREPDIEIVGLLMFEEQGNETREAGAAGRLSKTGPSSKLLEVIRSVCRKTPT